MTFSKDRFLNYKSYSDPFPIFEITNFLSKKEAQLACEILDKADIDEIVMENRKNIRKGTENFKNFLIKNKFMNDLYKFFNNEKQYEYWLEKLISLTNESKLKYKLLSRPKNFKEEYSVYKNTLHNKNLIKKISNYVSKKFSSIYQKLNQFYFFEMVFAIAGKGYKMKTHTDKPTRIIVFLLYLNNLNEDEGGSLEVYSRQNHNEELKIHHKFKPEAGKLIVFLSNPISFHNVEEMRKDLTSRKFIYAAYTSGSKINWLKS